MESEGRASTESTWLSCSTMTLAKKVFSRRSAMTTRVIRALSPSSMTTSRSWVSGRGNGSSESMRRIACASPGPIQIGRIR